MALARWSGTLSVGRLKVFLDKGRSSKEVLDTLVSRGRSRTMMALATPDLPPVDTACWLALTAKAVQCVTDTERVIDLLTMVLGTNFFTREITTTLSTIGGNTSEDDVIQFIQNLVDVISQVSLRLPNSFTDVFGHIVIVKKRMEEMLLTTKGSNRRHVQSLYDVVTDLTDTAMKRMTAFNRGQGETERQPPPEDFRTIPILPVTSDIFLKSRRVYLQINKAFGGYENLEHYLDVQFRLYREDFISPLRDGITEYVRAVSSGQNIGRLQDGKLYKKVVAVSTKSTIEGEQYVIQLDPAQSSKINWMSSHRLIYGSLVCLSADSFRKMHFAVVSESDRKVLQKQSQFSVVCPANDILRLGKDMTMVESSAYFEAYKHVLAGLQNIGEGELPFEKYIVGCRKNVDPPLYLTKKATEYDLQPILSKQLIFKAQRNSAYRKPFTRATYGADNDSGKQHAVGTLSSISRWPKARELHLDQSQFEAFHAALTQELVLIQGPPGTGKTHVGLQIAKTLLHNKAIWATSETKIQGRRAVERKCPMLVVCFTNHALDQFMEGIVNFLDPMAKSSWIKDIVRVGGRSENTTIEQFSLKQRRRSFYRGGVNEGAIFDTVQNLQQNIANTKYRLRKLKSVLLHGAFLRQIMSDQNCKAFKMEHFGSKQLFRWLGADEMTWIQGAQNAYYQELQTLHIRQVKVGAWEEQNQQELLNIKTDAELLEDDRRIEDDTVASLKVDRDIGLDIKYTISNMWRGDSNVSKTPQMDDHFKALFRQEAMKTFERLSSDDTMTDKEAAFCFHLQNLNFFSLNDRWRLYRYWVRKYKTTQEDALSRLDRELSDVLRDYQKKKKEVDGNVLKTATVIAMTTSGAARYHDVLKDIGPRIVIVEEAAEVLETHIVTSLSPKCEHLILIGDHKQLEPKPSVYRLAQKYNLGLSMFERMLNNGIENHCLQRQHRMRPEISTLVRDIYPVLEDNENVFMYDHVKGVEKDVFFINHKSPEGYGGDTRSYHNDHEACYVVALCRHLVRQGYTPSQITILAAYSGQMFCIRKLMPREEFEGVRAVAIDSFQGEETDIILLSLVRSNKTGNIGFLNRENRVCVALSRAKIGLYVVGNFAMFEAGSPLWAKVIEKTKLADQFANALPLICQNHPHIRTLVANAEDFKRSPEGGCDRKCDFRLHCGHVCSLFCHPKDKQHTEYKCKEKCNNTCENDHQCKKTCHFDKACDCPIQMKKALPCGHEATMKCNASPKHHECRVIVEKALACGHVIQLQCNIKPESIRCEELVNRCLGRCGHDATMKCFVDPQTFKCGISVTHTLGRCGHEATMECHEDVMAYKCRRIVTRELEACQHTAELECWVDSENHKCAVMLNKSREDCGHSFDVLCSKYSTSYESQTMCNTVISKCFPECHHRMDVACHIDIKNINCETIVIKHWDCLHTAKLQCWTSEKAACDQKCLRECSRGHTCYKKCHYPEKCVCKRRVDKTIPDCCHIQNMECHVDPGSVECPEIVIKEMPRCAHKAKMPCNTDPNTITCVQMVKKALIPCGHIQEVKCSADVSKINCREVVSKRIERCGHSKDMACSMDPCEFKCTSQVDRVLPKCGHVRKLKCSADPEKHQCEKIVRKRLPCDHEINMKCCLTPSKSTRCQIKVQIPRETCSHTADIECSKKTSIDPNELQCYKLTQQQLMCGHTRSVECCKSDVQQPCQRKCSVTLSCGHPCGGKCRTCSDSLFHETCKESCRRILICGHTCDNRKCGSCRPCNNLCENYCPHHHCTHGCASECRPCEEKCSLVCPHHQCSRLCSEQCDRPRCDRRCRLVLDCQHRCMGFCGNPCPASCITCGTKHIQDGISHEPPSEDTRLVRLTDCGHEFDSNYLDRIADGITNALDVMRCPKCNTIVRWHPRYVKVLKMQRKAIDSVKTLLNLYDTQGRMPKTVLPKEMRDEIYLYITRFHTYLYIQEKLHHETTDAKLLTEWALTYTQMFAKLLNNSHQNIEMTPEQVHCINRNMCKLSAVWLLLIGSQWENRSASSEPSEATGTYGQTSGDQSMENITEEQKALNDAEDLIRKEHSFTTSCLHKVREILEPVLVNASEVSIAFDFPVLVAVGIHRDDWIICDEGHSTPLNIWSKKTCQECSSENLLNQHGLVDGGANGEAGCGRGQSRGYGRGRGRVRSRGNGRGGHGEPVRSPENITLDFQGGDRIEKSPQHNGSTRGRVRGSRGRGRGGGLKRSRGQGNARRGMGDSVKVDTIQNSEGHSEKRVGKNGREFCGEIVGENRKERGGTSEREHDKWSDGKYEGGVGGQNKLEHGRGGHGGRGRGDNQRESRGGRGSVRGGKGRNAEGGEGGHDRVIKDVSTGGNQERGRGLYDKESRGGHGGGRGGRPGGGRGGGGGSKRVSVEGNGKGNSEVCAGVHGRGSQEQLDVSSKGVRGGDNEGGRHRGHRGGSRGGYGGESRGGRGRERGGGRGSYRGSKGGIGEVGGNWSGDGGRDGISKRVNGGEDEGRDRGPDEESRGHGGEHGGMRDRRTKGECGEGSEAGDGADRGGESKRGRGGWSNGGSRGGRSRGSRGGRGTGSRGGRDTGSRGGRGTGSRGGRGTGRRGGRGGISS